MLPLIKRHARRFTQIRFVTVQKESLALRRLERAPCDAAALARDVDLHRVKEILSSPEIAREWAELEHTFAELAITDKAGGVNPGDRRALYHLLRALRPKTMLEIGTHIGASTVHAAAALSANQSEDPAHAYQMTTVDVVDVNDRQSRPWIAHGSTYSPRQLVERIGVADRWYRSPTGASTLDASSRREWSPVVDRRPSPSLQRHRFLSRPSPSASSSQSTPCGWQEARRHARMATCRGSQNSGRGAPPSRNHTGRPAPARYRAQTGRRREFLS